MLNEGIKRWLFEICPGTKTYLSFSSAVFFQMTGGKKASDMEGVGECNPVSSSGTEMVPSKTC